MHVLGEVTMGRQVGLKATIAERGQVTIPKTLREKLGLSPGTVIYFDVVDGQVLLRKESAAERVKSVYGIWKDSFPWKSTDEYIEEIRGPVE